MEIKVYISGATAGTEDYLERFEEAEKKLTEVGYSVINPRSEEHTSELQSP